MRSVEFTIEYRHAKIGPGRQGCLVGFYYYNKFRTFKKNKTKKIFREYKPKDRHKERSFGLRAID